MGKSKNFRFDGGAADHLGTSLLAFLVTLFSLGFAFPYAVVLVQRWRAKHTYIEGRRLIFLGTGLSLFGNWLKWFFFIIVTLGIYSFWVVPKVTKWVVENIDFDPMSANAPQYLPQAQTYQTAVPQPAAQYEPATYQAPVQNEMPQAVYDHGPEVQSQVPQVAIAEPVAPQPAAVTCPLCRTTFRYQGETACPRCGADL